VILEVSETMLLAGEPLHRRDLQFVSDLLVLFKL